MQATTFPTENPPRNPSLLDEISTNTLPPAKCFDNSLFASQNPLHRLLRSKHCLSVPNKLYIADRVPETGGSNGGSSSNDSTIWQASFGTCQAFVELHEQMTNKISGQVWMKILRAFPILYTDHVKTRDFGGQISVYNPGSLEPAKKYVVKLRKTSIAYKDAAQKSDVSLAKLSVAHRNDSQSPSIFQVNRAENKPLAAPFATLKRICSKSPSKGYTSHHTKKVCHSFCSLARGVCDGATTGRNSNSPQQVAETAINFDSTTQAGKVIATGLHIKEKEESAHSAVNELSSFAIERRNLDLLSSVGLEVGDPHCYDYPHVRYTAAELSGCREDIEKLRFDSTGPVKSALWIQNPDYQASGVSDLRTELVSDHCELSVRRYQMGGLQTSEDLIWGSAPELLQKLSHKCLSGSYGGGVMLFRDKSTERVVYSIKITMFYSWEGGTGEKTSLLGSAHDVDTQFMQQGDSQGHKPAQGKLAALRRFCSKDRLGGRISERTKEICHSYCDSATAACAVATVALYGINHQHVALITAGSAGVLQFGNAISTRLAIPRKENSAHAQAESNHRFNPAKAEDEDPLDKMEKNIKHRRSIDRRRRKALIGHSLVRAQEMQVHSDAYLQRKLSY